MDTTITAAPIGSLRQRMLQDVQSVEEAARLNEAAPGIKYKAIFSVAYGAGLRVSEVTYLKVGDIDSERMIIRCEAPPFGFPNGGDRDVGSGDDCENPSGAQRREANQGDRAGSAFVAQHGTQGGART
ncbi:phage integrase family protein [Novosphingobium sp. PhB55]|nr:phage integrase family protein [Novosphingobium sp. PhB55]